MSMLLTTPMKTMERPQAGHHLHIYSHTVGRKSLCSTVAYADVDLRIPI